METLPTSRRSEDMSDLERMLFLPDRILMHLDHEVPPETEVIRELKEVIARIRQEHGLPKPVAQSLPGS
jgi:homoaconitase/3-isopropylmalate dehydratase large subunit